MSQFRASNAAAIACGVSTRSWLGTKPAERSSASSSSASSSESSISRSFRGGFISVLDGRRLVEHEPIESQLAHRVGELVKVDRLSDVAVRAQAVSAQHVALLARGGEDHNGEKARALIPAHLSQHLDAVHLRQLQIEQDELRHDALALGVLAAVEEIIDRLGAVA